MTPHQTPAISIYPVSMKPPFIIVSRVWIVLAQLHLVCAAPVTYDLSLPLTFTLNNASTHSFLSSPS